jgi:hypothetical protein
MSLLLNWVAFGVVTALAVQARSRSFLFCLNIDCLTGMIGLAPDHMMENLTHGSQI